VEGVIKTISSAPIADPPNVAAQRIRGGGRTLMPGLIDNHWHTMFATPPMQELVEGDLGYITLLAGIEAEATLMRGFTTVRDLGGPSFALKRRSTTVGGARASTSGAMITTGGHGDFRAPTNCCASGRAAADRGALNASQLADSPDEALARA
jgi:imidazolonepropionase-like amidohydrolase